MEKKFEGKKTCKGKRHGKLGALGKKVTATQCAEACAKDSACAFAAFRVAGGVCSSYAACTSKPAGSQQHRVFEKLLGPGALP